MSVELPRGMANEQPDRNPETSNLKFVVLVLLFVGFVVGVIWLFLLSVENLVLAMPIGIEQRLGALIVPQFERLAVNSPVQQDLNQLLDRLENNLAAEQRRGRDYKVLYVPDNTVNALAIPGDRVIIYKGLLQKMKSENELMMVLGHELGHFANRDHLRGIARGVGIQILVAVFLGDAGSLQSLAVTAAANISRAQFSQQQERQADDFGLKALKQTYGHVAGSTDFFNRLAELQGLDGNIAFLATHPAPRERVERLNKMIREQNLPLGEKAPLSAVLQGEIAQ